MGVEDDIQEFEKWVENLGFPLKSLPPKKTLSRIFASGQALAFNELMRRVKPMQEVKAVRDEVKVRKIERLNGKTTAIKPAQSEQIHLYQTKKKLEERLQQLKTRVNSQKQQYQKLVTSFKEKNIEKIQLREEIANIAAKNGICKLKTNAIEQQIVAEKEIGEKIDEITPVKFTANNAIEKNGRDALENAKNELQAFYTSFNQNENYEVNLAARQQLWQKLRDTFAHIPNVVLWTSIGEQMKQNMLAMETLSKMDVEKILYADCGDPSAKNSLQIEIGKLYAKHIKLCIMRHGVNKQSEAVTSEYVVFYESFLNDLRAKFQMYNNQTVDDDFLADYLAQYSALHYGKGEVQYLLKLIDENESEIQRRKRANDEYRNANTELSNLYGEMEKLYIRSHEDIYSLTHVREKIQHSEELTRYLLQCKKDQQMPAPGAELSRMNASVNSSLSSNNDSVLYRSDDLNSTTFSRSEVGMPRSNPVPTLPNQLNEIKTFLSIPIDKFKLRNPIQEHLDLCMNPLINLKVFSQLPNEVKMLVFDYTITPAASIKLLQSQINWFNQIKGMDRGLGVPDDFPEVDETKLILRKNQQNDALAEITDEASAICVNVHRIYRNIQRYIQFINENPLSKFVPKTETFNGKTYQEYEREFMMYYKMIQKADGL